MTDSSTPPVHSPPPPKKRTGKNKDAGCPPFRLPPGSVGSAAALPVHSPPTEKKETAHSEAALPVDSPPTKKKDTAHSSLRLPPGSDGSATAPLPSPIQRRHDLCRAANSRALRTVTDLTRLRLRRRIQKIYQMATDVVDGYGDVYYNKHLKPLPQETIDKIMLLYHNRIERRCQEVGITVEEEEQWNMEDAEIDPCDLSDSGEESEEHDSDDVNFYSGADDDDDDEEEQDDDDDNVVSEDFKCGDDFEEYKDARQIRKWEQEIKTLRNNLKSDLLILQRMTCSPNRKNPYNRFDEWSDWKKNDVDSKVAELNAKIKTLQETMAVKAKESTSTKALPGRKRKAK